MHLCSEPLSESLEILELEERREAEGLGLAPKVKTPVTKRAVKSNVSPIVSKLGKGFQSLLNCPKLTKALGVCLYKCRP